MQVVEEKTQALNPQKPVHKPALTFKDRALPLAAMGVPVIRLKPRSKEPVDTGWQNRATTDVAQIEAWDKETPDCNAGAVAKSDGVLFFESDEKGIVAQYERETGGSFQTFTVQSRQGFHFYFKQSELSRKVGSIKQEKLKFGSLRQHNAYVVSANSIHPETGKPYKVVKDVEIAVIPDSFLNWLVQKAGVDQKPTPTVAPGQNIEQGGRNDALTKHAGKLRHDGLNSDEIEANLLRINDEICVPPLSPNEIKTIANSVGKYPAGHIGPEVLIRGKEAGLPLAPAQEISADEILIVDDIRSAIKDMPEECLGGDNTLANICRNYMGHFPRAYAWPAILTVAGAMVPRPAKNLSERLAISSGNSNMTNFYTSLIGPVGSGKGQACEYAKGNLGMFRDQCTETKAGSIEGLLNRLNNLVAKGELRGDQVLVDVDEWSHLFKKANIDSATFVDMLNSGFNKSRFSLTVARGQQIELDMAISIIGGMPPERVQECFGSESTSGFYDRFLFGVCPTVNPHIYRPFDPSESALGDGVVLNPIQVSVDKSVWKLVHQWRKADTTLDRTIEIIVRCAVIIASFDNRPIVFSKDVEALRPLLDYQTRCRLFIQPNPGLTFDAKMCNAILGWLEINSPNGQWMRERDLKRSIRRTLETLGPQVYNNAKKNLAFYGSIEFNIQQNKDTRPSEIIRLVRE